MIHLKAGYIILGLAPSLIWLLYYLKQDVHPEPKKEILKAFFLGVVAASAAGGIETLIIKKARLIPARSLMECVLLLTFIAAVEEILKYGAASHSIFGAETDEPIDVSVYMITSAMGFASLENIVLFFTKRLTFLDTFFVSGFRFIGATLLHALCSGILGFFLASAFLHEKEGRGLKADLLIGGGFLTATLLHALYNFSIIKASGRWEMVLSFAIIFVSAFLFSILLKKLKKLKSICKD